LSEQYFHADPQSAHDLKILRLQFQGTGFQFETDAGVFSKDGLDEGTSLLLETALPYLEGRVLDLGCGWGAAGVITARLKPGCRVVMTDINSRAAELAGRNITLNKVQAEVFCGDGFQAVQGNFSWILLNPPIRAGKQAVYEMFRQSADRLSPDGCLAIVIRKQQGALSAKRYLDTLFQQVELVQRKKGYHIYYCRRGKHEL
jgi:16S rRNA (guanine1207-N2)-methyltransferase